MKRLIMAEEGENFLINLQEELNNEELDDDFLKQLRDSLNDHYNDNDLLNKLRDAVNYNIKVENGEINGNKIYLPSKNNKVKIEDPFFDETGRGEVNPIEYYGKEKIKDFIKQYELNINKEF
ncbi:MAG: hypothetical protein ACOCP8_07410 [archaeon]